MIHLFRRSVKGILKMKGVMEMTLALALNRFFNDRATYCKMVTLQNYRVWLSVFTEYMELAKAADAALIEMGEITREDIKAYNVYLRERYAFDAHPNNPVSPRKISKTSVRTYMVAVRALYTFLYKEGYLETNPMQGYRMIRKEKHEQEVLTAAEVRRIDNSFDLREEIGLRNWLIVHLMLDAGLRRGEVSHLQVQDIDLQKNIIYVRGAKGDKDRMVLLPGRIRDKLCCYRSDRAADGALLLCRGGRPLTQDTIKNLFNRLKYATGIERLHPHLLRHTFATSFIYYGGQAYDLMFFLGHSSLGTTQGYVNLSAACRLLRLEIYKIDEVFFQR